MSIYPVDLHTHTTASDGKLSPTEMVALAARQNMHAIAITDHDTVAGVDEAITAGKMENMVIVPAVELSTRHEAEKAFIGIHILGYFINHQHPSLQKMMEKVQQGPLGPKSDPN